MKALQALLAHQLRVSLRARFDWITALLFFIFAIALYPLAVGNEPMLLQRIGGGIVIITTLLAALLTLPGIFADDHIDGTLTFVLLSPTSTLLWVYGKIIAHWVISGLPLLILTPFAALLFGLPASLVIPLVLTIALMTTIFSFVGVTAAALMVGGNGQYALAGVIVLPLLTPTIIFAAGIVDAATQQLPTGAPIYFLLAILTVSSILLPMLTKMSLQYSG